MHKSGKLEREVLCRKYVVWDTQDLEGRRLWIVWVVDCASGSGQRCGLLLTVDSRCKNLVIVLITSHRVSPWLV